MRAGAHFGIIAALVCAACDTTPAGMDGGGQRDAGPPADAGLPPPPPSEPGRHDVEVVETRRIVPSEGLPPAIDVLHSNNNLDVIRHSGRTFLAWRTSVNHYANTETVMHVVSSDDEVTWTEEASFALGTDLREPRLLELGDSLFLYISVLGADPLTFTPMGVRAAERRADGTWTDLEDIGLPGYIAWRTRTERGTPYMLAYLGGEHIYQFDGIPLQIDLLTSTDGRAWSPVDPSRRTIYTGGGSETDFALGDDDTLYGIIRNEAGDANGFGSMVCSAPAGEIANWTCHTDPKKYDSPLMFWHDDEAYLVGRRNVTDTGYYDLMSTRGSIENRAVSYEIDYVDHPKRCSLWRYVQGEDRIAFILDLPSGGDTCFPGWLPGDSPDEIVIYNYSSDIDDPDIDWKSWHDGQFGDTYIYRHVLRFTPR